MKLFKFWEMGSNPRIKGYVVAESLGDGMELAVQSSGKAQHHILLKEVGDTDAPYGARFPRQLLIVPPPLTHVHKKRGTQYRVISQDARLQAEGLLRESDNSFFTIYQAEEDNSFWVRPTNEFNDGRFRRLFY